MLALMVLRFEHVESRPFPALGGTHTLFNVVFVRGRNLLPIYTSFLHLKASLCDRIKTPEQVKAYVPPCMHEKNDDDDDHDFLIGSREEDVPAQSVCVSVHFFLCACIHLPKRSAVLACMSHPWNCLPYSSFWCRQECEVRGATIIYATHIFDGLEGWLTHLAFVSHGKLLKGMQQ